MSLYVRVRKDAWIRVIETDTSYRAAVNRVTELDESLFEFDIAFDVVTETGEVVNEAGWKR